MAGFDASHQWLPPIGGFLLLCNLFISFICTLFNFGTAHLPNGLRSVISRTTTRMTHVHAFVCFVTNVTMLFVSAYCKWPSNDGFLFACSLIFKLCNSSLVCAVSGHAGHPVTTNTGALCHTHHVVITIANALSMITSIASAICIITPLLLTMICVGLVVEPLPHICGFLL